MAHLNFGASLPAPTITVKRGASTALNPLTGVAKRAWEKAHPETTADFAAMKLLPFNEVWRKLLELQPRLFLRPIGDGRLIIGYEKPSQAAIASHESMTFYERRELDTCREVKDSPRIYLIAASQNAIEPYTELWSAGRPQRVVARSLRSIVAACVEAGAFGWRAAEKKFGMPLEHAVVKRKYLTLTPAAFHARNDSQLTVAAS